MGSILEQPKNSRSHYHIYKGTDSIILMKVVDPEYQSFYLEVGMNGRNSNGGAWAQSPLRKALENNTLNLSKSTPVSGDLGDIPFVSVGDDALPLSTYMMKIYPQKDLSCIKIIFNYSLYHAKRISEMLWYTC